MSSLVKVEPEYVYMTIPAEYVCVYQKILAMLADYGEDMLKDCKASCTDRNSGVIECFNMFNAAVAARKLGKDKLAETLIKYIKCKINQIYKGDDNSPSFVFPIDENGDIKAFVSCDETVQFEISAEDGELYYHKFGNGKDQHFVLGEEDTVDGISPTGLDAMFTPMYHRVDNRDCACCSLIVYYDGKQVSLNNVDIKYEFDGQDVLQFEDVTNITPGYHTFKVTLIYHNETKVIERRLRFV